MKKLFFFCLTFLLSFSVMAQDAKEDEPTDLDDQKFENFANNLQDNLIRGYKGSALSIVTNDYVEGVKGTRYFYNDKYQKGELWLVGRRHFKDDYTYKFDQILGTIQAKSVKDGVELVLDPRDVILFHLKPEGRTIVFMGVAFPAEKKFRLLQIIHYGEKFKLLRDSKKVLRRAESGSDAIGGNPAPYDEYKNDFTYYLARNDDDYKSIKISKKGFIKSMPDLERKIEQMFKQKEFSEELTISKLAKFFKKLEENQQKPSDTEGVKN